MKNPMRVKFRKADEENEENKKTSPSATAYHKKAVGKREFNFTFFSLIGYNVPIR